MNEAKAIHKIFRKNPQSVVYTSCENGGLTNRISSDNAGVGRYEASFSDGTAESFIGKRKSVKIITNGIAMASGNDRLLRLLLLFNHKIFGYNKSTVREAVFYRKIDKEFRRYLPEIKGVCKSITGAECFIAMEYIEGRDIKSDDIYRLIDVISEFHAHYFSNSDCVKKLALNSYTARDYKRSRECLKRMFDSLSEENLRIFGEGKTALLLSFISDIHVQFPLVEKRRTLTHNDFSERNIIIDDERVCIVDWELAAYQNPEHDLIELIISVMDTMTDDEIISATEYYRSRLTQLTGISVSKEEYGRLLKFNTYEYCVNKLSILRLASKKLGLNYTDRLVKNAARLIEILR